MQMKFHDWILPLNHQKKKSWKQSTVEVIFTVKTYNEQQANLTLGRYESRL